MDEGLKYPIKVEYISSKPHLLKSSFVSGGVHCGELVTFNGIQVLHKCDKASDNSDAFEMKQHPSGFLYFVCKDHLNTPPTDSKQCNCSSYDLLWTGHKCGLKVDNGKK